MCRITDDYQRQSHRGNDPLKINAFSLHLSLQIHDFPDYLTLIFLPRINGSPLGINGSEIRSDTPAFLTLHRYLSDDGIVFTSKDHVSASDGALFEVHVGGHRLIRGVFLQNDRGEWMVECRFVASEREFAETKEAEVSVAAESGGVMRERVRVAAGKRRCSRRRFEGGLLADIPEERVCDVEDDVEEKGSGGYCCCCDGDEVEEMKKMDSEMEMESVRWAVDLGIWVVCLGVGLLVSRASTKRLRWRNLLC